MNSTDDSGKAQAAPLSSATAPEGDDVTPRFRSIPELFQHQVRTGAGRPALHYKSSGAWKPISWDLYGQAVRRMTGFLLQEGVEPAERVAILSYNRPEWHIADLASLHAGATTVGIYLTNSPPQCQYIIEHAEARVVFVEDRAQLDKILEVRADLPRLRRVVVFDSADIRPTDGPLVISWSRALELGEHHNGQHQSDFDTRWRAVGPHDMATFIYTSGTTGPPKAVMLDHHNLLWTAVSISRYVDLDPETDVQISYLPLAHIAERVAGHVLHIQAGHRLYFTEDLGHFAANVGSLHPTVMFGVPRIWEKFQAVIERGIATAPGPRGALARWALRRGYRSVDRVDRGYVPHGLVQGLADRILLQIRTRAGIDRMRHVSSGAAPIGQSTLRFYFALGLPLYEVYGQSEGCGPTAQGRRGHSRIGTAGPPVPGVEVRIAADGEVLVRGGNVFRGYFKDQEATAEALDTDGWLHSGDVGHLDQDGFLTITDRKKDLIITSGGKNISPSNIEMALQRQPFVGHAVAIGDRRPFMAALLTVDAESVADLAKKTGEAPDMEALARSQRVRALFQEGIDAVNRELSNVERVKNFAVLPADLTVDGGELTPTLKVKRKVVNEKYAAEIEALYSRHGSGD